MQIKNFFLLISRQFSQLQKRSEVFWRNADNSYLASPEFYASREAVLRDMLAKIGPVERALDVGCGDGRFTMVLREMANQVVGYDISEPLIAKAQERSEHQTGVTFRVAELEQVPPELACQIVTCLGVTSCVSDEGKFGRVLDRLAQATVVGGHLVMIDTLSDGKELARAYRNGYVGKYRGIARYEREISNRGMKLIERRHLAEMGGSLQNYIFVFQRSPG